MERLKNKDKKFWDVNTGQNENGKLAERKHIVKKNEEKVIANSKFLVGIFLLSQFDHPFTALKELMVNQRSTLRVYVIGRK